MTHKPFDMTSPSDKDTARETKPDQNSGDSASAFKHPLMAEMQTDEKEVEKKLTKGEMVREAFSLIFALQGMKKFQRAADQLENKPIRIVIAGFLSIALFMGFCYTAANLALHVAKKDKKPPIENRQNTDRQKPLQSTKEAVQNH